MVKALILYFLSIKPTHGYEIQKYIKINHVEDWTKIQSGSIYYALGKLEKQGFIQLIRTEGTGKKSRKIYDITEDGNMELNKVLKEELGKNIYTIGSDKFILYPFVGVLKKEEIESILKEHIETLVSKKHYTQKWRSLKITGESMDIEKECFDVMINSLNLQIKWNNTLLKNIDQCIRIQEELSSVIKHVDFSDLNNDKRDKNTSDGDIEQLKQDILKNPEDAKEKLELLINILK